MRTALYIEQGILQVVLTPETEQEKRVLDLIEHKDKVQWFRGSFYETRGGWMRYDMGATSKDDSSLILRLDEPRKPASFT